MFFNKPPSHAEVVNDTHQHLVNLFRVAKHHPQALQEEVRLIPYSRAEFEKLMAIDTDHMTDIQRAAWFFLSLDMSFGGQGIAGGFAYCTTGPTKSRWTLLADIDRLHDRLARVTIECLDYADCMNRYDRPDTCFFVDPPYIGGAQKNYDSWSTDQMEALADILRKIQGKFLLTVNDSAECREIFQGHQFHEITRQSLIENRKGAGRVYRELLIVPKPR